MRKRKIEIILLTFGLLMLFTGLLLDISDYKKDISDKEKEIVDLKKIIKDQQLANTKLRMENDALWDNYYMNVSEYDGEYYE